MELRWSALVVVFIFMTAFGSSACSDGNDGGGAAGGFAGSSAGSGSASGASHGGAGGAPSPTIGLQLTLRPPNPPIPNTDCFDSGMIAIGDPPPTLSPFARGESVSGGDSDVSVVCSVNGPGPFTVSATVARGPFRFKIRDGTIDATAGAGTFELLIDTEQAGDIVTEVDQLCTFDVSEDPLEVSEGSLFAAFDCPVLWNHATATDTACAADGVLVLEHCTD
jgi:hypothetical protein